MTSLPPVKKGRTTTYFDGTFTDGTQKQSVNIKNCQIKEAREGYSSPYQSLQLCKDILIADHTGESKQCLWERYINKLHADHCYSLKNFMVREYNKKKFVDTKGRCHDGSN